MQPTPNATYIAVTRCSTDKQLKHGNSHEYQIAGIRASGVVRGLGMKEVVHLQDTVTGTRFDNRAEGLDKAYKLCEKNRGQIQYIFVYRWDRLGRDVGACFDAVKRFREIGVEVNCPDEWVDYSDASYPAMQGFKFGMAQGESMKISERTKSGQHAAMLAGVHIGKAPVGYNKSTRDTVIGGKSRRVCEVDPEKSKLVHDCFVRFAAGEQRSVIFRSVKDALGLNQSQFFRMFNNVYYTGRLFVPAYKSNPAQIVPGLHEAIVSIELFDRCQKRTDEIDHPTRGRSWSLSGPQASEVFYLKGVLNCAVTGTRMRGYYVTGRHGKKFPYYSGRGVGAQNVLVPRVHGVFIAALSGMRIAPEHGIAIRRELERQLNERIQAAKAAIAKAQKGKERTAERLERLRYDYADGNLTAAEYRTMKQPFEIDAARFDAEIIEAESRMVENDKTIEKCLSIMESIDTIFLSASDEYRNRIAKAVFPSGVSVDIEKGICLTPEINDVIFALCGESIDYTLIKIKKPEGLSTIPAKGQTSEQGRTPNPLHLQALKLLFAA